MKILLFILAAFIANYFETNQGEYVCEPCGAECDTKIHSGPGVCPSCNMRLVDKSTIGFTNLSVKAFCARMASNPKAVILDVRSPGEFNGADSHMETFGHFKNAININISQLESRIAELTKYKDLEILLYCSHSHRSPRASYLLGTKGFKNVKNMAGGVSTIQKTNAEDCIKEHFVTHSR